MKDWKCPNCMRESFSEDDIVTKMCPCGEYMEENRWQIDLK